MGEVWAGYDEKLDRPVAIKFLRESALSGVGPMGDYPALHAPSRPDWACLVCGDEWPCATRKRQLVELFAGNVRALVRYLLPYLVVANTELGHLTTSEVTERLVGWCPVPPHGGWGGRVRKREI